MYASLVWLGEWEKDQIEKGEKRERERETETETEGSSAGDSAERRQWSRTKSRSDRINEVNLFQRPTLWPARQCEGSQEGERSARQQWRCSNTNCLWSALIWWKSCAPKKWTVPTWRESRRGTRCSTTRMSYWYKLFVIRVALVSSVRLHYCYLVLSLERH